jgi:glycosyltransferase involved in cell wall biosynthesis
LYTGKDVQGAQSIPLLPGIEVHRTLTYGNPLSWRRGAAQLDGADILHLQVWTGFLAPALSSLARAAQRRGIKVVATLHNVEPHEARDRVFLPALRRLLRHVDLVLVHSPSFVDRCAMTFRVPAARIGVVPHPAYSQFGKGKHSRAAGRASLGLRPDDVAVLQFGTIRPYKGLGVSLDALALLPDPFKLVVAGECWEDWGTYESRITSLGIKDRVVARVGYVPDEDLQLYFQAADVAIFPYVQFEAQSGAALAAIGAGLPVVASRVGALPDVLDARTLVDPANPSQLAEALRRFAADPSDWPRAQGPSGAEAAQATLRHYEALV